MFIQPVTFCIPVMPSSRKNWITYLCSTSMRSDIFSEWPGTFGLSLVGNGLDRTGQSCDRRYDSSRRPSVKQTPGIKWSPVMDRIRAHSAGRPSRIIRRPPPAIRTRPAEPPRVVRNAGIGIPNIAPRPVLRTTATFTDSMTLARFRAGLLPNFACTSLPVPRLTFSPRSPILPSLQN
jgi:hypothetical protein